MDFTQRDVNPDVTVGDGVLLLIDSGFDGKGFRGHEVFKLAFSHCSLQSLLDRLTLSQHEVFLLNFHLIRVSTQFADYSRTLCLEPAPATQ